MIYSTITCPICNLKLKTDTDNYWCEQEVEVAQIKIFHYEYNTNTNNICCTMVFPPYILDCYPDATIIYRAELQHSYIEKQIFKIKKLDWDWSKPYNVVERINLLTKFI